MSIVPTTPVAGSNHTGFTSPTWTIATDFSPVPNGRAIAVTGKGGTQPAAVDVSSASRPFSALITKPAQIRQLPAVNPTTGVLPNVPMNQYGIVTRKGVTPLAGQPSRNVVIRTTLDIPAGADLADPDNIVAAVLFHIGLLQQQASGVAQTAKDGQLG